MIKEKRKSSKLPNVIDNFLNIIYESLLDLILRLYWVSMLLYFNDSKHCSAASTLLFIKFFCNEFCLLTIADMFNAAIK